jgi:hypothetical protein
MIKNIDSLLQSKIDELHFIQATLNNLELVKKAQNSQNEVGWSNFTSNAIRDFKVRATGLQKKIIELREEQEELYRKQKQEANDQVAMSMGYL